MKIISLILFILLFVFINGCSTSCNDLQTEVEKEYGKPEEVNNFSSGDYTSTDWWYWSKGIEFTFTKSGSEPCKKSTYTFEPIKKITEAIKNDIKKNKKLINVEYETDSPISP